MLKQENNSVSPTLRPAILRADNFTAPQRTPWGGRKLLEIYKKDLELGSPARSYAVVGEAWEISVDSAHPSRVRATGESLAACIATDSAGWLGEGVNQRHVGQLPLLVKWIDTADTLSVQVHPTDAYERLQPGETGKWEAWCIIEAEPGAAVHLGFQEGVGRADVERCLRGSGRLDELLNRITVRSGDVFVIEPGTPHALGAGVTLLEPQYVTPQRHAVTYRFWDWNRGYDDAGRLDDGGRPRPLHVTEALEVTRWDLPGGEAFVRSCRRTPRTVDAGGGLTRSLLLQTDDLTVERWQGSGAMRCAGSDTLTALTCITGEATIDTALGACILRGGESAVIPAKAGGIGVAGRALDLFAVSCAGR
jgi:mannose-6-phosphate isomerase